MKSGNPTGNKLEEIRARLQAQAEEAARREAALLEREEPPVEPGQPPMMKVFAAVAIGVILAASWTTLNWYLAIRRITHLPPPSRLDLRANSITSPNTKRLLDEAFERVRVEMEAKTKAAHPPKSRIEAGDAPTTPTAGRK